MAVSTTEKYSEVKIGYINKEGLFVVTPQFIQPSVAIETGLVFLSVQQLERREKKTLEIFMGVPRCLCISILCVCVCAQTHTHAHTALM